VHGTHGVEAQQTNETVVDVDVDSVLGTVLKKTFVDHHMLMMLNPLSLWEDLMMMQALNSMLHLLSVGNTVSLLDRWIVL